jgi:S1-C subfamily serine protease
MRPVDAGTLPTSAPEPVRKGGPRWGFILLAATLAGLIAISEITVIAWALTRSHVTRTVATSPAPIHSQPQATNPALSGPFNLQQIAKKVDPSVVDINTTLASASGQSGRAAGTGIILSSSGQVLTNNHVVESSTSIKVTVMGHSTTYSATVVGVSPIADVALIQLEGVSSLPAASIADSSKVSIGDPVAAIGNALGQGGTPSITQGTITALNQSITISGGGGRTERLSGLIQSDAAISPGDSGGPLVNAAGQVIGMITAGESSSPRQTTTTIGYSIPTNNAVRIVNQIRAGQASADVIIGPPGYLGVSVRSLDAASAAQLGLSSNAGVLVIGVASGSPAAQAGIGANSVITAIDAVPVASVDALGSAIRSHKPGQPIKVSWVDQGGPHTVTVNVIASAGAA